MSIHLADATQEWLDISDAMHRKATASKSRWIDPNALDRRQAWIDTIVKTAPTHAVTLIWNAEDGKLGAERIHCDIKKIHCRIDRKLSRSRKFSELPFDRRTGYIGFIERPITNTHAHLAWRVPQEYAEGFENLIKSWWHRLHPYGEIDVQPIYDPAGWAAYIVKDQWRYSHSDDAANLLESHSIIR